MAASSATPKGAEDSFPTDPNEPTWFGHPKGLAYLFFAEMWERFCFYGMRALLVLYIVAQFKVAKSSASEIYGAYMGLVYGLGVLGGYVADKVVGYRRSIVIGGVIMAIGEFLLVIPPKGDDQTTFLLGLSTLIVGVGLFKPNISSLVGKLYKQGDPRRDRGFTIFYMGINIGAFLAPLLCSWAAYKWFGDKGAPNFRAGFALAGAFMLIGVVTFRTGYRTLGEHGLPPKGAEGIRNPLLVLVGSALAVPAMYFLFVNKTIIDYLLPTLLATILGYLAWIGVKSDRVVRDRIVALIVLLVCNVLFWASFEQAGNSLTFFADKQIHKPVLFGDPVTASEWQSLNALFIVLLAPVFTMLWRKLENVGKNPSIPFKFGLGIIQVGLGFGLLMLSFSGADAEGRVPWIFLAGLYLIHTAGELCISPVGLSMVTKLAPAHITGFVMGGWFLSIAFANNLAGIVSAIAGKVEVGEDATGLSALDNYSAAFTPILWSTAVIGVVLCFAAKPLSRLMHGIK